MFRVLRNFALGCTLVGLGACHRDPTRTPLIKLKKKAPPMRMELERMAFSAGEPSSVLTILAD